MRDPHKLGRPDEVAELRGANRRPERRAGDSNGVFTLATDQDDAPVTATPVARQEAGNA
jgi:hypothetical protein